MPTFEFLVVVEKPLTKLFGFNLFLPILVNMQTSKWSAHSLQFLYRYSALLFCRSWRRQLLIYLLLWSNQTQCLLTLFLTLSINEFIIRFLIHWQNAMITGLVHLLWLQVMAAQWVLVPPFNFFPSAINFIYSVKKC